MGSFTPSFTSVFHSMRIPWSIPTLKDNSDGEAGTGRRDGRLECCFATLPGELTLDTISADETASDKPRAYLRQLVVRWSKEGRIKRTGRGMYQKT